MESPLDLSLVKKEPGLEAMCPSDSGIFDNMMSEEFHESSFHSMHHPSDEVHVDWLSIFDEVPSCAEQTLTGYSSLTDYSNSSLHYGSAPKASCLGITSGLAMDAMVSFPEECANESMYCSTPHSPAKPHTPDNDSHSIAENFDVKRELYPRQNLFHLSGTTGHLEKSMNGRQGCMVKPETDIDQESVAGDGSCIPRLPIQSEYATLKSCRKYSYDSGSHSPKSAPTTPPRVPEDNEMPVPSTSEATSPLNQQPQERQNFFLTEEERRTLITEGLPVPTGLPLTKLEERSLKKVRRKIKNKISAQESRRKKKEYMETLEKRVESCTSENQDLRKKVDSLENSNRSLITQLQKLQSLLTAKVRPVSTRTTQTSTCLMVVVLCFAVFLGGWSPLTSDGLKFSSPGPVGLSSKTPVDYSTPSVRSRVLMSVVDESEDFDSFPMGEVLVAPASATPAAALASAENSTHNVVARETKNNTQIMASFT